MAPRTGRKKGTRLMHTNATIRVTGDAAGYGELPDYLNF